VILFEAFITPGTDPNQILSADIIAESGAQVFTPAQAKFIGLEGIPEDPEGRERAFIACRPADQRLIVTLLERSDKVLAFKLHQLG